MIYFIEHAGWIKVGYASDVERRLKELRTANPSFARLGIMNGERGHEKTIHDSLVEFRGEGEWFKDCPQVREYLMRAMRDGVEEWKPEFPSTHLPSMWDGRAKRLCEIIIGSAPKSDFGLMEQELSSPRGTLWMIRYRQNREVSVGEYFALVTAARATIERRKAEIERSEAFVADLEMEDAESTNQTFDAERALEAAYAAIHTHPKDPPQ
jgi:hypothetical protein